MGPRYPEWLKSRSERSERIERDCRRARSYWPAPVDRRRQASLRVRIQPRRPSPPIPIARRAIVIAETEGLHRSGTNPACRDDLTFQAWPVCASMRMGVGMDSLKQGPYHSARATWRRPSCKQFCGIKDGRNGALSTRTSRIFRCAALEIIVRLCTRRRPGNRRQCRGPRRAWGRGARVRPHEIT